MAGLRNAHGLCPPEVLRFLLDLFKYNDNSKNRFSDNYYRAALIDALSATVTPVISIVRQGSVWYLCCLLFLFHAWIVSSGGLRCVVYLRRSVNLYRSNITADSLSADTKLVLEEVTRCLNLEKLLPSYKQTVTVSCLKAIRTLQKFGHLPNNPAVFRSYSAYGNFIGTNHVNLLNMN